MADTSTSAIRMAGKSVRAVRRVLPLATALVFLSITHPSGELGAKERIAAGMRAAEEYQASRAKHQSAIESPAHSEGRTSEAVPPTRRTRLPAAASHSAPNPTDVAPIQATVPQTRPARSWGAPGSLAWLRPPSRLLWLIWLFGLPWLLIPVFLLSAICIFIWSIRMRVAGSGQVDSPVEYDFHGFIVQHWRTARRRLDDLQRSLTPTPSISSVLGAPESAPSPQIRKREDRHVPDLALRPMCRTAIDLPEIEKPSRRPTGSDIVDLTPPGGVPEPNPPIRDYQVMTIANNKGGVGKSTLAVNLAVYIRALREDLPILLISFDDQTFPNRMFALDANPTGATVVDGMLEGSFASTIRMGEYGIEYVPADKDVAVLKRHLQSPLHLRSVLDQTGFDGLILVDTKSDLEILTLNAIEASDLTIVPVADHESLLESEKIYELLDHWRRPHERACIALTLIDLRVRYRNGSNHDILSHLVSEIRERGFPLFQSFISRSPKIQSLHTNPEGRVSPILLGAPASLIHRQMRQLTEEVLASLDALATVAVERKAHPIFANRAAGGSSSAFGQTVARVDLLR
jgi:cellulose biosynthesis protein BcsQ